MLLVACAPAFGASAIFGPAPVQMQPRAQIKQIEDAYAKIALQQAEQLKRADNLIAQAQNSNSGDKIANLAKQIAVDQTLEKVGELSQTQEDLLKNLSPAQQKQVQENTRQKVKLSVKQKDLKELAAQQKAIQAQISQHQQQEETLTAQLLESPEFMTEVRRLQKTEDKRARVAALKREVAADFKAKLKDLQLKMQEIVQKKKVLNDEVKNLKAGARKANVKEVFNEYEHRLLIESASDLASRQQLDPQTKKLWQNVMDNSKLKGRARYNKLIDILAQVDARKVSDKPTKQQVEQAKKELNARFEQKMRASRQELAETWVNTVWNSDNPEKTWDTLTAKSKNPKIVALAQSMLEARRYKERFFHMGDHRKRNLSSGEWHAALVWDDRFENLPEDVLKHLGDYLAKDSSPVQKNMQQNVENQVRALDAQQKQELAKKLGVSVDRLDRVVSGQDDIAEYELNKMTEDTQVALTMSRSEKEISDRWKTDAEYDRDAHEAMAQSMMDPDTTFIRDLDEAKARSMDEPLPQFPPQGEMLAKLAQYQQQPLPQFPSLDEPQYQQQRVEHNPLLSTRQAPKTSQGARESEDLKRRQEESLKREREEEEKAYQRVIELSKIIS
jgi:hypothetical protein